MHAPSSILPAVTVASVFSQAFGWNTLQIGLAYGCSLTIGSFLGETAGGWVVDFIIVRIICSQPASVVLLCLTSILMRVIRTEHVVVRAKTPQLKFG